MEVTMEERRRGNRIKLESTLVLNRLDGNEGQKVEIDISDVSKSGIGFNCKGLLEIGSVYEAFLRIWTQEVIHAFWRSSGSKMRRWVQLWRCFHWNAGNGSDQN